MQCVVALRSQAPRWRMAGEYAVRARRTPLADCRSFATRGGVASVVVRGGARRSVSAMSAVERRFRPLLRVLGYYGPESTRGRQAEAIFKKCVAQSSLSAWNKRGAIQMTDFRPNHAVLFLHVWLVHRRLYEATADESKAARLLQEAVFDELWEDTTLRVRATGVAELSNNKHLTDVQKYSFQAALEYDDALASPDAEKADKLAAALWRSVWLATEEVSVEHCEELARYTQAQLEMLRSCSLPDLLENKFEWAVPKFTLPPASTPKQP